MNWPPSFSPKKEEIPPAVSSVEENETLRIIRLKGIIDMTVIPEAVKFKEKIQARPDFQYKNMLFDFKNVDHIDSSVVAEILLTLSELKQAHHKLGVINLKESFRDEFRILRVDQLIAEYPTESDAIRDLTL